MTNTADDFILDLEKDFELNLQKANILEVPTLRTRFAGDKSGSMRHLFNAGFVQRLVDLFIPAALKFDDDGNLEVAFFNNYIDTDLEDATAADAGTYMKTKGAKVYADGGTAFHPIIEWTKEEDEREGAAAVATVSVTKKAGFFARTFLGAKDEVVVRRAQTNGTLPDCGQYCGIVTDGQLEQQKYKDEFEASLKTAPADCFYQFIGLGPDVDSAYLTKIASRYPNVAYFHVAEPLQLDNNHFYEQICNPKFAAWIANYNKERA